MWRRRGGRIARRRLLLGGAATGVGMLVGGSRAAAAQQPTGGLEMGDATLFLPGARAGELAFAAHDGRAPDGSLGGARDAMSQAQRTMAHLRNTLRALGHDLDQTVSLWVLLTDYADLDAVSRVVDEHFPEPQRAYPATCYLGVSGLDGGCLVRMDAVASASRDRSQIVVPGVPLSRGARTHGVRAGDLYFLSAVDAADTASQGADRVAELGRQTTVVLDRIDTVLNSQGLWLGDVGRSFFFLTDLDIRFGYTDARRQRYQGVFPLEGFPANSGIGVPHLGSGVMLRGVVVAGPHRAYVSSEKVRLTPGLFSQSVRFGDWLFVAGQDAIDLDNQTLAIGNVAEQTEITLEHVKDIVEAGGGTLEDVVKTTVYVIQGEDLSRCAAAYRRFFEAHTRGPWLPTGLTLGVKELATDCLVEIDAVAYLGPR